jgi:hypothetical protein
MRGISTGNHTIKVELNDLFPPCSAIKEEPIDYVPVNRKAVYRKIPIARKSQVKILLLFQAQKKKSTTTLTKQERVS